MAILQGQSMIWMWRFTRILMFAGVDAGADTFFTGKGSYHPAIQDRNEALQISGSSASCPAASQDHLDLGKYAEALKEFNYLVSIHPRSVTLVIVSSDRAVVFRRLAQTHHFRNGRQAIKDAKAACSIMTWKDENMIDMLAAAHAEYRRF